MERFGSENSKKVLYRAMAVLMVLGVFLVLGSCTAGRHLTIGQAGPAEVKGTFTLILYGCRYRDDIENLAILDREGDRYSFKPYAPAFQYKTLSSIPAEDALKQAEQFVRCSFFFRQSRLRALADPQGNIAGYEVRPLYSPLELGQDDVLDVRYRIDDGTVTVFIQLWPNVERKLSDDSEPFLFRDDGHGK